MEWPVRCGDAVAYDSRLLHCGGANRYGEQRQGVRGAGEEQRQGGAEDEEETGETLHKRSGVEGGGGAARARGEGGGAGGGGGLGGERVVFYLSFACPGGVKDADNVATLVDDLKGKHSLRSLRAALEEEEEEVY